MVKWPGGTPLPHKIGDDDLSVADGAVLRVVPTFQIGTVSKAQNVYHMLHQTGSAQTEAAVITAALESIENMMSNFTAIMQSSVSLIDVACYELVSGAWEPIGAINGTWAGTSAAQRIPAGVALMVRLFKARTGYVDRKYLTGFTESQLDSDLWTSAVHTAAAAYIVDVYSPFTASNSVILKAVHFNRNDQTTKDYTGGNSALTVSYQRRRKPGVGLT